jgi:hypothetical protein
MDASAEHSASSEARLQVASESTFQPQSNWPGRLRFSLPPLFAVWSTVAVALMATCVLGWWYAPVRPEPFDDPPSPFSLAWWVYAPADPGLADLDMVPVGNFGGFLTRDVARRIRQKAPFNIADIADEHSHVDGKEILVSLRGSNTSRSTLQYSADGGLSWIPRTDLKIERCNAPGQALKIHDFEHGGASIWANCFPTPPGTREGRQPGPATFAQIDQQLKIGSATSAIFLGQGPPATFSQLGAAPEGIWLTSNSPTVVFSDRSISYAVTVPNKQRPTILHPLPGNRVIVASADGFTSIGIPDDLDRDTSSNPFTGPLTIRRLQRGPTLTVSPLIAFDDPAHANSTVPVRTIRISSDEKSIIVAQQVARDSGVLVSHDGGKRWSRLAYITSPAPWVPFIMLPLAMLATAAAARQLIRTPASEPSIADEAATDRPIGLRDIDALQFGPIARGLLMFIRNPRTEPPVTIAVTGQWGSGKTSLMNILRDLLRDYDARPVWFNAWHHQKEEHLLAALIENIRRQAIPSIASWAGLFFRLRLLRQRIAGRLGVLLVLLATALFIVGGYLSLSEATTKQWRTSLLEFYQTTAAKKSETLAPRGAAATQDHKAEGDWLLALVALLPSGLAIPALLLAIMRNLQPFPRAKPEQLLSTRNNKGDFASKLSFRYRFEREFRETAAALRNAASPGLVVFIDDLDRCHAKNVVELLEAINFIVSAGECFVILGIAKDQIRRSILASYKGEFIDLPKEAVRGGDIEAARRRFADRYLEKLINIEVPVPQANPTQIESLLTGTAKRPDPPPGVSARRRFGIRIVYDNGPAILAFGFLLSLFMWLHPYIERVGSPEATPNTAVEVRPPPPRADGAGRGAVAPEANWTIPLVYSADKDLAVAAPRAGWPWAQVMLIVAILSAIGAYLLRLWVVAKQRPASDSPSFRQALELWSTVIFLASGTPRAVKQYKNVLRYQAMRLRSLREIGDSSANIPEPYLVALGAIALANREFLIGAMPPKGKPIQALVLDATTKSRPEERPVLEQISISLNKQVTRPGANASLELCIPQYLALLPPVLESGR